MCLTCNCLLFLEYYGVDNKKKMFVLIFIFLRLICMMTEFIWAIVFFASSGWIYEQIEELIKQINADPRNVNNIDLETQELLR